MSESPLVAFTVDTEPDCPPYLSGFRGIEHGMHRLLDLLAEERVPATVFTTGDVATRLPEVVDRIDGDGHELASDGITHRAFTTLEPGEARREIEESATTLRRSATVTSFRAPYSRFPSTSVPPLESAGFTLDSSQAKYKAAYYRIDCRFWTRDAALECARAVLRGYKAQDARFTRMAEPAA